MRFSPGAVAIFLFSSVFASAVDSSTFHKRAPAAEYDASTEYWFDQLIDHTNPSAGTFKQRYFFSDEFYAGHGAPVVLINPGEQSADGLDAVLTGESPHASLMERYDAAGVVLEHRYWGKSSPYPSLTADTAKYQAAQDYVYFVQTVQLPFKPTAISTHPDTTPWVNIGCSYPYACRHRSLIGRDVGVAAEDDYTVDDTTDDTADDTVDDTADDTVDDTADDTVDDTADDTVDDTADDTVDDTADDTVDDTVDDTADDTVDDTVDDTADDTVDDTADDTVDDTADDTIDDTADDTVDDTADDTVDDTADDTVDDTADDTVDDTADDTVDDTADDTVDDTADDTVDDTADDTVDDTADDTVDDTADDTVDDTADDTVDDTADDTVDDTTVDDAAEGDGVSSEEDATISAGVDKPAGTLDDTTTTTQTNSDTNNLQSQIDKLQSNKKLALASYIINAVLVILLIVAIVLVIRARGSRSRAREGASLLPKWSGVAKGDALGEYGSGAPAGGRGQYSVVKEEN